MDPPTPRAEAVAVLDGRIIDVGGVRTGHIARVCLLLRSASACRAHNERREMLEMYRVHCL